MNKDLHLLSYLTFDANCREAIEFYKQVFGGELTVTHSGDIWRRIRRGK